MPRRIPGAQIALVCNIINDFRGENFTTIYTWEKDGGLICNKIKLFRDKRKSRKGESFGQCIKISYDMLDVLSFAFVLFGSNKGVVNKGVNNKVQSSLCSNEARAKFCSIGGCHSSHISPDWKANRAFKKQELHNYVVCCFYSVGSYYINYESLLRYRCENIFETVES
jgi:hypothetical protein